MSYENNLIMIFIELFNNSKIVFKEINTNIIQMDQNVSVGQEKKETKLVDIQVTNEIVALNLMVSFLNMAQRRGVFTIDESAKIWECIKKFQKE